MARFLTSYKPEYCEQAYKLCLLGARSEDLARFFGCDVSTIYRWQKEHEDFFVAVKGGKEQADARVAESLYRRACGYEYKAQKVVYNRDAKSNEAVDFTAHQPPDTMAAIFWLKNRRPDLWRDLRQHEVGRAGDFASLSDDELRERAAQEVESLGFGEFAAKVRSGALITLEASDVVEEPAPSAE